MRICQTLEATGGGSGRDVLNLVIGMIAQGHEVTLIYSPRRAEPRFLEDMQAIKGLKCLRLDMHRAVGWHDISASIGLYRLLGKHGPFDIIHSHSSKAGGLTRLAGLPLPGVQIYTPHAFMTMDPHASPIYGWIEWLLSWCCDKIVPVSLQEERHAMKALKIPEHKLHTILNGVELDYPADRATARHTMGYNNDEYVIGFVGRLVSQKNPQRAILAFAKIAKDMPSARLAMVGDGPLRTQTGEISLELGVAECVKFFSGQNARDLMPGFDCLLCSSDYESFGLIFPEALDAGVPIVTTPVGVAEETAILGETGFITKTFSADELAEGLRRICALMPEERARYAINARQIAKKFDVNLMVERTMDLYRSLLQKTKP